MSFTHLSFDFVLGSVVSLYSLVLEVCDGRPRPHGHVHGGTLLTLLLFRALLLSRRQNDVAVGFHRSPFLPCFLVLLFHFFILRIRTGMGMVLSRTYHRLCAQRVHKFSVLAQHSVRPQTSGIVTSAH